MQNEPNLIQEILASGLSSVPSSDTSGNVNGNGSLPVQAKALRLRDTGELLHLTKAAPWRRRPEVSDDWRRDGLASLAFSILSPLHSFPHQASAGFRIERVIVNFLAPTAPDSHGNAIYTDRRQ